MLKVLKFWCSKSAPKTITEVVHLLATCNMDLQEFFDMLGSHGSMLHARVAKNTATLWQTLKK